MGGVNRAAIEEGLAFEDRFAKLVGGKKQIGSGNRFFAKLDVNQMAILWSLKSAPTARSIRVTDAWIREMLAATEGPGGTGVMPALALDFIGIAEPLTVVRTSDFFSVLRGEVQISSGHTKGQIRRATADTPMLLR
jgi:hypothetical protein